MAPGAELAAFYTLNRKSGRMAGMVVLKPLDRSHGSTTGGLGLIVVVVKPENRASLMSSNGADRPENPLKIGHLSAHAVD